MTVFKSSRQIPAPVEEVFAVFSDAERLARWWGPDGFTNTFETFAFEPESEWRFIMHGPDGKDYPNEMRVKEITRPSRIVLHHTVSPRFLLSVTLEPAVDGGTLVGWEQEFGDPETGRRMKHILEPANEQVFDRLAAEVANSVNTRSTK